MQDKRNQIKKGGGGAFSVPRICIRWVVKPEYGMNYRKLLTDMNVDQDAVMEFFIVFSRFEFALKRTGYLKRHNGKAEPDWRKFETKHKDEFDPEKESELREAWNYIDINPPKIQVVVDGKLDFEVDEKLKDKSPFKKATMAVRTVRNNLFHGGKFPRSGIVDNPDRKTLLLKKCTLLLEEMLELDPNVKMEFYRTEN